MNLLTYLGPWCCEKGEEMGARVCPKCDAMNKLWSGYLSKSDEEWKTIVEGKPYVMVFHSDGLSYVIPPEELYLFILN